MKKYFMTSAIISMMACSAVAQNVVIGNGSESLRNLPTKEIVRVTHSEDNDGNGSVAYEMLGGATYQFSTQDAPDAVLELPVDLSAYNTGDLYQILERIEYTADEFIDLVYDPESTIYGLFNKAARANNTLLEGLINKREIHYVAYDIEYVSTDVDGEKILLSGRVLYPMSMNSSRPVNLTNIYLDNHYTMFANRQAPSQTFENSQLAGMCTKGYLQVMPDFIGFGSTVNRTQLFIDSDNMARHNIDCVKAALQLVKQKNISLSENYSIINAGGSQGAGVALGVHRYIENNLSAEDQKLLPIKETRIMAGPYSPELTMNEYCRWNHLVYSPVIPCLVQSMKIAHPEEMKDYGVNDFFCEDFGTYRYARYKNRTIWELLDAKEYDSWDIRFALFERFGDSETYSDFRPMMASDILNPDGETINKNNPKYKALAAAFAYSDLTHGWTPKAKVTLFHSEDDDIVPYANTTETYNNMKAADPNANVSFYKVDDTGLGHTLTCGLWYMSELSGIDVNLVILTVLSLLK